MENKTKTYSRATGCVGCVSDQKDLYCITHHVKKRLKNDTLPCGKKTHASYCKWCGKIVKDMVVDPGDMNKYYHEECKEMEDKYREPYDKGEFTDD